MLLGEVIENIYIKSNLNDYSYEDIVQNFVEAVEKDRNLYIVRGINRILECIKNNKECAIVLSVSINISKDNYIPIINFPHNNTDNTLSGLESNQIQKQ